MMDTTTTKTDDYFFIEEPHKLRSNFFNKDKSIQLVEILAQQQHLQKKHLKHRQQQYNNNNNIAETDKMMELSKIQTCRLTYIKKLQQSHSPQQLQHTASASMPRSFIDRLECLCKTTYESDDLSIAKRAVDALSSASKSGCCFLEKYIVMLLNFCIRKYPISSDAIKIKIDELLSRVLIVEFDRQQLIENLKRHEYKLTSVEHLVQLLQRVQDMLDYREPTAVDWLIVLLDAYFVDLATSDEVVDIINQISDQITFQCALLRETENTRCLLKTIVEISNHNSEGRNTAASTTKSLRSTIYDTNQLRHKRPYYAIEYIEI